MKTKKFLYILFLIILFLLLLVPNNSCVTKRNTLIYGYPKDSKWIYYDGIHDSTVVYVSYYGLGKRLFVKDSLSNEAATTVGWVDPDHLFPIK